MNYYINLQFTRLNRKLEDLGINPWLALIVGLIVFIFVFKMIFVKIHYAKWITLEIGLLLMFKLCGGKRNDELRKLFSFKNYYLLRLTENAIVALPFFIYLLLESEVLVALLFIPMILLLAIVRSNRFFNFAIPTPFKKFPFEFIVGFRQTFWLIGISYFLIFKALQVDNYFLGLFGLATVFFTSMYYYIKPEEKYFVWIHSLSAKQFLRKKFMVSVFCVSILAAIPFAVLIMSFPSQWMLTLLTQVIGYTFVGAMIVAKYSSFPFEMNVPQGIFLAISLMFPVILIIAIWVFYSQSKKRLEPILEC